MTGWAQVNGRNSADWPEKLAMDTWYVDHVSFVLDLKILLKTVTAVFARRGISADGHATVPGVHRARGRTRLPKRLDSTLAGIPTTVDPGGHVCSDDSACTHDGPRPNRTPGRTVAPV